MPARLDKFMLDSKLVRTRSQARMLIKQGDVLCNGEVVTKAGRLVSERDKVVINTRALYVGRGAFKLLKAIEEFSVDFKDKVVADCGASTGGFTQVSLLSGARKVYAIDVGHDQLDELLKNDPRVVNMEGTNLKNPLELREKVDICVADLSFISLTKVYKTINSLLKSTGIAIVLVKPQFEAGRSRLGKGGIVKEAFTQKILDEVLFWFKKNNFTVEKICESPIQGKEGNREYLAYLSARF